MSNPVAPNFQEHPFIFLGKDYHPPLWLRNPHLQSLFSSSQMRCKHGQMALQQLNTQHKEYVLDGGQGIRLLAIHSEIPNMECKGMAILLHGWEGSVESSYMGLTAAQLLQRGYQVFRINFRDHGNTHHLNEALFHSNRLDEIIYAIKDISERFDCPNLVLAGYSLGGNFALRIALHAPEYGLLLDKVAAVCPVLDPKHTMQNMLEKAKLYNWYFRRKWVSSLRLKQQLFPQHYHYDEEFLKQNMQQLTEFLAKNEAGFSSIEDYFEGYSIGNNKLLGLTIPSYILMAEDDPVIPFSDFKDWKLPKNATLDITKHGGHCGFLENIQGDGFAEHWVAERLTL